MLPGEVSLPETIFAPNEKVVNQLFGSLCNQADRWLAHQFESLYMKLQIHWFVCHGSNCPVCSSASLIRKGWRQRVLKSTRGRLNFLVLQARCKNCGRTFRPFTSLSGLPSSRRFLDELIAKAIDLAIQMPFAQSSRILKTLTNGSMSHEGVRQKVAQRAKQLVFATANTEDTVLVDSTKVKAGVKTRGASVHLAITAKPGPKVAGRKTIIKKLLHLHVGGIEPLRKKLNELQPQRLVHDGGEDYSDCARYVQRCNWHLVHQLKHYLWQDGIAFEKRGNYQNRLNIVLWDTNNGIKNYALLAKEMEVAGLTSTTKHLKGARDEAFTWVNNPGFSFTTTSPLEREMRELNRRADVGARWSINGIENVLKVLFHKRLKRNPRGPTGPR
jgi:transposase-like protein